jgi:hypothetical protein
VLAVARPTSWCSSSIITGSVNALEVCDAHETHQARAEQSHW